MIISKVQRIRSDNDIYLKLNRLKRFEGQKKSLLKRGGWRWPIAQIVQSSPIFGAFAVSHGKIKLARA